MSVKLDPTVIDRLREQFGLDSFEQVGAKIGRTAFTVRQWHTGHTCPSAADLVKLQHLTGRPYGSMLIIDTGESSAA